MLTLLEIDGQLYHAQQFLDEEGENVIDTIPILDEDGDLILQIFAYVTLMSRENVVVHVHLGEIIGMMNKLYTKLFGTWKTTDELFYNDSVDGPSCIVVQKNSKSNKERAYVDHFGTIKKQYLSILLRISLRE